MKILSANQIKEADAHTIKHEPITSIALMERASKSCADWIVKHYCNSKHIYVFCGPGNNGGDGFAISRMLNQHKENWASSFCINNKKFSKDSLVQLDKNKSLSIHPFKINNSNDFPEIQSNSIIVDALFGTGINRAIEGIYAELINYINHSNAVRIAIDMPSGLYSDQSTPTKNTIVKASITLSFELVKLAFLFAENAPYCGKWHILKIGLNHSFINNCQSNYHIIGFDNVKKHYRYRATFSHKGTYGHVCMVAGSYGKAGAAVLAGKACMKAGVGLLSYIVPEIVYQSIQQCVNEAMVQESSGVHYIEKISNHNNYIYAIGPGIGQNPATVKALLSFLRMQENGLILDADALNIIAKEKALSFIPKGSILSPHPKEFERLFGKQTNDFERLEVLRSQAIALQSVIILKGAYTCVSLPNGEMHFNTSGNPGMATGGSGDVLTGLIAALVAQHYSIDTAALMAVYLHGKAADIAFENGESYESITAHSIIEHFAPAFRSLY